LATHPCEINGARFDNVSSPDVAIKAWLEGHQFDLADLAAQLAEGDVRVEYDDLTRFPCRRILRL